jgi:hypothetical protein
LSIGLRYQQQQQKARASQMISLIVLSPPPTTSTALESQAAEAIVRTLSAFVGAAVRGLVREAVLIGPAQIKLDYIADHAGCTFVEAKTEADGIADALPLARAAHLMIVRAGYVPETGFAEAIEDLLRFGKAETRGWIIRGDAERPIEKILSHLVRPAALLAPRRLCLSVKTPTFAALIKATRARPARHIRLRRVA